MFVINLVDNNEVPIMKKFFCSILILITLCSCKVSSKVTSEAAEGLAKGLGESFGKSGGESIASAFSQQGVSKQQALWQAVSQINQSTPIQIDQETILSNAGVKGDGILYRYELINYSSDQIDPDAFVDDLRPAIQNSACSNPDMKPLFQNGVSFYYSYYGNDKKYITEFGLTPANCGY